MPYDDIESLPESVRNVLPQHAQEIYRAAYNSAWEQYENDEDRQGDDTREEVSHKVAWSAVKQKYHKEGDQWKADE
jgi:cation transport regulator